MGRKEGDNLVREVPFKKAYSVSIPQVATCLSFSDKINGSLDWGVQHFLLFHRIVKFPILFCN